MVQIEKLEIGIHTKYISFQLGPSIMKTGPGENLQLSTICFDFHTKTCCQCVRDMEIRKSFYDLCVPYTKNHKELSLILKELYEC